MHKCPIIFSKPEVLSSDPKAALIAPKQSITKPIIAYQSKLEKRIQDRVEKSSNVKTSLEFLNTRPYRCNTAFGYTTLIDTQMKLKSTVFRKDNMKMRDQGLDDGELKVMDYLIDGSFYSHTG